SDNVAAAQTETRLGGRPLSFGAVGSAWGGAARRRQGGGALRRSCQRPARPETPDGRRRRQCRAFPGSPDRDRGRDRPVRSDARKRLRRAIERAVKEGGGIMSKAVRHFLDINE